MSEYIAVLGIAQVASMALTEQIVVVGGSVAAIREQVESSVYWPAFCELVAAGEVTEDDVAVGPVGVAVIGWAQQVATRSGSE